MTRRLEPLVDRTGRLRKRIALELADEPDTAARRDGVNDGRAERNGAARLVGDPVRPRDPTHLVGATILLRSRGARSPGRRSRAHDRMAAGERPRSATPRWADALFQTTLSPALLAIVPAARATELMTVVVAQKGLSAPKLQVLLATLPAPWSRELSFAVIDYARRDKSRGMTALGDVIATHLSPDALSRVEQWMTELKPEDPLCKTLRKLQHACSLRGTITEEFA